MAVTERLPFTFRTPTPVRAAVTFEDAVAIETLTLTSTSETPTPPAGPVAEVAMEL